MASPDVHTVYVKLADIEPVASFIAQAVRADTTFTSLTAEEIAALPPSAVGGMAILHEALETLGVDK